MKYFKVLLLLLISNLLISQSSTSVANSINQTVNAPATYTIEGDNLKPPICFVATILEGASIIKKSNKQNEYYVHNSRKYIVNGPVGSVIPDVKYLAYKSTAEKIGTIPLQKIGSVLSQSTNNAAAFSASSEKLFDDISSLSLEKQKSFIALFADNPELVKAWVTLSNIGFAISERTNSANLNAVLDYFSKYPNRTPDDVKTTADLFNNPKDYLNILPDIVSNSSVEGTNFEDFESVSGFKGDFHNAEYSFYLWSEKKWSTLESFFNANSINGGWPPNNGGYNESHNVALVPDLKFDRYSGAITIDSTYGPILGGTFTSPIIKGKPFSFAQRALNKPENAYDFYYTIEVIKELPFTSLDADVIPWFGQVGNGKQAMWNITKDPSSGYPLTWNKLVEFGYIKVIIKSSPSGKYPQFVNFAIQ